MPLREDLEDYHLIKSRYEMLSVVIRTKNEEENIGRCTKSTQSLSDEVIVINSGSEDRTVKIARNLGAKVFYNKWIDYPV